MKANCFEIGTIQAFLDGETTPDQSLRISDHLLECEACSAAFEVAENETSLVMATLDRELDSLVPTQRLWNRINESIAVEKKPSFFAGLLSQFRLLFVSPSVTAAAGVAMALLLFAGLWIVRQPSEPVTQVARNVPSTVVPSVQPEVPTSAATQEPLSIEAPQTAAVKREAVQVKASDLSPEKVKRLMTNANVRSQSSEITPQYAVVSNADYMPGEDSYVRTIRDLKQDVDSKKDSVLNPSSRIAYERDMAVVDDAITKMRDVVKKNPKNQAAKQVLYASYQDKIDLLNSVSQRSELMASLK